MEYLIFSTNGEPKVTGIRDGSGQSWFDDAFWKKNANIKQFITLQNKLDLKFKTGIQPDFSLDLLGLVMDKNSKHIDLININGLTSGFIISTRFRSILETFHLPNHQFYEVSFNQPDKKSGQINKITDYWYFYFEKETGEVSVDFSASTFDINYHINNLKYDVNNLVIKSYDDYMRIFYETGIALQATKLVINRNFDTELDFWGCRFLSPETYVSKRLLNAMEIANITGYKIYSMERARQIAKITDNAICELIFE